MNTSLVHNYLKVGRNSKKKKGKHELSMKNWDFQNVP